jgi:hypothetical protein
MSGPFAGYEDGTKPLETMEPAIGRDTASAIPEVSAQATSDALEVLLSMARPAGPAADHGAVRANVARPAPERQRRPGPSSAVLPAAPARVVRRGRARHLILVTAAVISGVLAAGLALRRWRQRWRRHR